MYQVQAVNHGMTKLAETRHCHPAVIQPGYHAKYCAYFSLTLSLYCVYLSVPLSLLCLLCRIVIIDIIVCLADLGDVPRGGLA